MLQSVTRSVVLTMKILLITPPMTQLNAPYPATAYLTAHLKSLGHEVRQADLGLELALKLFSREGLTRIRGQVAGNHDSVEFFREAFDDYAATIDPVIRFLQGKDPTLAIRIAQRSLLPEGPRFLPLQEHPEALLEPFGKMGVQDLAKYRASLYLDDLADVIRHGIDESFEFSRYGERLASSQASFKALDRRLRRAPGLIDEILIELLEEHLAGFRAEVVGFSVPFPGNVYAALRMGAHLRGRGITRVMGGGFVNTELREISDPRIFNYVDFLSFDDGEGPLAALLDHLLGQRAREEVPRIKYRGDNGEVSSSEFAAKPRPFRETLAPDFSGLPLDRYVSMLELPNPMFRLWSDFRWNKMILAHGCYWKKCTFCDVHLDYIGRYEPHLVPRLVDHIEQVQAQTGGGGFHFVDEAAPPALLKSLSQEILRRDLKITWWGNLRFDAYFTPDVAQLMADAGCVAVTGGLEVASPRLLALINKGIDLPQVEKVTRAFRRAGIFVHAYLMYGFPTQTESETYESLENVRRLFAEGCLDSAHWHRFLCTAHSPVGRDPARFGVDLQELPVPPEGLFARYEVPFRDQVRTDHDRLGEGLKKALYNYMHGMGLNAPVGSWFR